MLLVCFVRRNKPDALCICADTSHMTISLPSSTPSSTNHLARAEELRRLQRYDLALQEVQRALALDPHASAPHVCAAWILRDQKRLPEAEQAARAALAAE